MSVEAAMLEFGVSDSVTIALMVAARIRRSIFAGRLAR